MTLHVSRGKCSLEYGSLEETKARRKRDIRVFLLHLHLEIALN